MSDYYRYWGKTNRKEGDEIEIHLLPYHLLDVAACGWVLLEKSPRLLKYFSNEIRLSEEDAKRFLCFMLALHDIGKFSHRFQNLSKTAVDTLFPGILSDDDYFPRHDSAGFDAYNDFLNEDFEKALNLGDYWQDSIDPLAEAVFGHHGRPTERGGSPEKEYKDEQRTDLRSYFYDCANLFQVGDLRWPESLSEFEKEFMYLSWTLAGFTVASDWFGSASEKFGYIDDEIPLEEYWKTAQDKASEIIENSGVLPEPLSSKISFAHLFPDATPRPMQVFADTIQISNSPSLYIIEDATGSGKTEAALTLAGRLMDAGLADGMYVGLPTMATANQMYERVTNFYRRLYSPDARPSVVLAHGKKIFNDTFNRSITFGERESRPDEESSDNPSEVICREWVGKSNRQALLASVGIGTIDQAMLSCLHVKFQSIRLFGLFGKVLIVDEIHAYDAYMDKIICALIKFHASRGGSVILLSATLPSAARERLIQAFCSGRGSTKEIPTSDVYPLVLSASDEEVKTHINIEAVKDRDKKHKLVLLDSEADVEEEILNAVKQGECVCWIRNTVDEALRTYDSLVDQIGEDKITLFHARFAHFDRQRIEDDVLSRFGKKAGVNKRRGQIVIATQVIEQSLDVDFDLLISDLAPIDLLIQRAGRQHRHARTVEGDFLESGQEQRSEPRFLIHGPKYSENPTASWHKDISSGSAAVYSDTRVVYRTAKVLSEKSHLVIPQDSRVLVESVYNDLENVPATIRLAANEAMAEALSHKTTASFALLNWKMGYVSGEHWSSDLKFPTRLGAKTERIRLIHWDGEQLSPYSPKGANIFERWSLSEVSIRSGWTKKNASYDGRLESAIKEFKKSKEGKYFEYVWVDCNYDRDRGLVKSKD